jgi:hypothetical protein
VDVRKVSSEDSETERPSTLPDTVSISLNGFESEEAAHRFAAMLREYLFAIGRNLNLERLVAVTVAYDYQTALANIDRGIEGTPALTATSESYGIGVAMTPAVLRDGQLRSHMVFNANVIREIEAEEINRNLFYLIAHECGHVHDLKARDETFPNFLVTRRYFNIRDSALGSISAACWEEYAACYFSAPFSSESTTADLTEIFIGATRDARARANQFIAEYRVHAALPRVISEVGAEYGNVLKFAAYLLGQLHGQGLRLADCALAIEFIAAHWCSTFIHRLDEALSALMARYGEWEDIAEFATLETIADDLLQDGGIIMSIRPENDVYVAIPFTPETTPAFS